jgi:hypothetical protein
MARTSYTFAELIMYLEREEENRERQRQGDRETDF